MESSSLGCLGRGRWRGRVPRKCRRCHRNIRHHVDVMEIRVLGTKKCVLVVRVTNVIELKTALRKNLTRLLCFLDPKFLQSSDLFAKLVAHLCEVICELESNLVRPWEYYLLEELRP